MSSYSKRTSARRSDDTMDDDTEDKDDTKRKSRNLSEKKRRDQFNMLVNELSSMVSTGSRKMDKSTVLRSTISFLKSHNEIAIRSRAHEIQEDWKPAFLSNEEFTHLILEALDGFIVVFSAAGHVHYVSESITALLGHLPSELLNTSVYELVWDEEQAALYQALVGGGGGGGGAGPDGQLSFQAHLRRGGSPTHDQHQHQDDISDRNDCYELVNFVGYLRTDVDMLDAIGTSGTDYSRFSGYSGEADTRLFVGTGRLQTPQLIREMSLVDSANIAASMGPGTTNTIGNAPGRGTSGEFTSRHSLEWKFLFLDHRAPPIIGYLPFEVLGTSGYDYYHVDDLDKVVTCHEALMQKGEGTSCYYRFLTKGQQWIWLQTRFYITYHQWNSKPEFIVCTHRVVSYVDVIKQTRKECDGSNTVAGNESVGMIDSSPLPTSTPGSGTSSPWGAASSSHRGSTTSTKQRNHHRRTTTGTPSDCTSMSADSPGSRQSQPSSQHQIIVQHNGGRATRMNNHGKDPGGTQAGVIFPELIQHQSQPSSNQQPQPQTAPQYVTTISVQPAVITGFPSPAAAAVLSPLPAVDNGALVLPGGIAPSEASSGPAASHLHAQLQRKHAELQAIIGQQQAELRRVSEQLLMARLGLLAPAPGMQHQQQQPHHQQQQQPQQPQPQQQQQQQQQQPQRTLLNVTVPYVCNNNVSSTTTSALCVGGEVPAVPVPISVSIPVVPVPSGAEHLLPGASSHRPRQSDETTTMTLSQQQATQMLFVAPSSSTTQHK